MVGIYKILNKETGDFYIGSSRNIRKRLWTHRSLLRKGTHYNCRLQRSFDKYGEDCFIFEKLCECEECELTEVEQSFLDTLNPSYNLNPIANRPPDIYKPVIKYDLEGNIVDKFDSVEDAGGNIITEVIAMRKKTYKGHIYTLVGQDPQIEERTTRKVSGNAQKVAIVDKNGDVVQEFDSALRAARSLGLEDKAQSSIHAACKKNCGVNKGYSAKGYNWIYVGK